MSESEKAHLRALLPIATTLLASMQTVEAMQQITLLRLGVEQPMIDAIYAKAQVESKQRCDVIVRELLAAILSAEEIEAADWWKNLPSE